MPSLCSFTWHESQWIVGEEKYPVPSKRQQIGPGVEDKRFQGLAPLQLTEDVAEGVPQTLGGHFVENLPHLRVAGNLSDAEQRLEVPIAAALVEGQQRGILQREHGEGRHQRVGQGNRRRGSPRIGYPGKAAADQGIEGIRRQVLADLLLGIRRRGKNHGNSFRQCGLPSFLRTHDSRLDQTAGERLFIAKTLRTRLGATPHFPGASHAAGNCRGIAHPCELAQSNLHAVRGVDLQAYLVIAHFDDVDHYLAVDDQGFAFTAGNSFHPYVLRCVLHDRFNETNGQRRRWDEER